MLIRFFKTNQPASLFAVPILVALFWLPAWLQPFTGEVMMPMPLYRFVQRFLIYLPAAALPLVGVTLISFQSLYLNYLVNQYEVLFKKSYLPALFFVVLSSSLPILLWLHPALFAGSILVFAIGKIFSLYKNDSSLHITFDIGFLVAIASLFYFPAVVFLLLLFAGIIILRPFVWREWLAPLVGFILPYIFIGTYYFYKGTLEVFLDELFSILSAGNPVNTKFPLRHSETVFLGLFAFLLLLAFFKLAGNFFKNVIRTRNYQQVLLVMIGIIILPLLLPVRISKEYFYFLAIPLSVFVAYYFLAVKRNLWLEILFTMLLASVVFLHLR